MTRILVYLIIVVSVWTSSSIIDGYGKFDFSIYEPIVIEKEVEKKCEVCEVCVDPTTLPCSFKSAYIAVSNTLDFYVGDVFLAQDVYFGDSIQFCHEAMDNLCYPVETILDRRFFRPYNYTNY